MRIHKEGYRTLILLIGIIILIYWLSWDFLDLLSTQITITVFLFLLLLFTVRFFRYPSRPGIADAHSIIAPADGLVLDIVPTEMFEMPGTLLHRVSIFMSANDVHLNWVPMSGRVQYYRYNPGKHLFARKPKSSSLNERCTLMIEDESGRRIIVRQIAGIMARRVVTYPKSGEIVKQGDELGFIKFGSRVDVFLPVDAEIMVKAGDRTIGKSTCLARWPS